MMNSVLCESPRVRHPQSKCASKCVRGTFLSAFICFFIIVLDTRFMFFGLRFLVFGLGNFELVLGYT